MGGDADVQLERISPQARRRRRLAQQQSRCCGCLLLFVAVVLAAIALYKPLIRWQQRRRKIEQSRDSHLAYFPIGLSTDRTTYRRYGIVELSMKLTDSDNNPLDAETPPTITVKHGGKYVSTIGGAHELHPRPADAAGQFTADWPVPWNAEAGIYIATVRWELEDPEEWPWRPVEQRLSGDAQSASDESGDVTGEGFAVARAFFDVKARKPRALPHPICVATWEEDVPRPGVRMRTPSGEMGDWQTIFDWCHFMGADTLWVRGAVTRAADPSLSMDQPFIKQNIDAIPRLAARAHEQGLKFGVWAMAYATIPESSNRHKPDYRYAKGISRAIGEITESQFISLFDERRRQHLIDFCNKMQEDENVDYVGLDYMRTQPAYELIDGFARKMPVELPDGWSKMTRTARWNYVADRVTPPGCYKYPDFYDAWNWYRAHSTARTIHSIVSKSELDKPLWGFILSWKHGVQHGQDPLMFTDAGISVIAPMLYEVESAAHYDLIVKDWHRYMDAGRPQLVPGDCADDRMHQRKGPLLLYKRILRAHNKFSDGAGTGGAFFHDISRLAIAGNMGPFRPREWAIAGGAAFSRVREHHRLYPLRASINTQKSATVGHPFRVRIGIENICDRPVRDITIEPVGALGVKFDSAARQVIPKLGVQQKLTADLTARVTQTHASRNNRFIVAVRITWPAGEYGEQFDNDLPKMITLMNNEYVRVR